MIETKAQPDPRVILNDVSWRLYTHLLSEVGESPGTRITYDGGRLQIMVVSAGHDNPNRTIAEIVSFACLETGIDYCPLGSTTFKREDLLKGFAPDSCFYFANAELVRGLEEIDLAIHPPPELVIEIDITSDSMNKLPIFAAVGVAEVWRYSRSQVEIFVLDGNAYRSAGRSAVLPALTAMDISQLAESSRHMTRLAWAQSVLDRIRQS